MMASAEIAFVCGLKLAARIGYVWIQVLMKH